MGEFRERRMRIRRCSLQRAQRRSLLWVLGSGSGKMGGGLGFISNGVTGKGSGSHGASCSAPAAPAASASSSLPGRVCRAPRLPGAPGLGLQRLFARRQ
eukprot:scaffold36298_cov122-Isochrysis_galbana.AAC.13